MLETTIIGAVAGAVAYTTVGKFAVGLYAVFKAKREQSKLIFSLESRHAQRVAAGLSPNELRAAAAADRQRINEIGPDKVPLRYTPGGGLLLLGGLIVVAALGGYGWAYACGVVLGVLAKVIYAAR